MKHECALKLHISHPTTAGWQAFTFFSLSSDPAPICSALYELQMLLILTRWPVQLFPPSLFLFALSCIGRKLPFTGNTFHFSHGDQVNWYHMQMQSQPRGHALENATSFTACKESLSITNSRFPGCQISSNLREKGIMGENHGLTHLLSSHALPIKTINHHVLQPH